MYLHDSIGVGQGTKIWIDNQHYVHNWISILVSCMVCLGWAWAEKALYPGTPFEGRRKESCTVRPRVNNKETKTELINWQPVHLYLSWPVYSSFLYELVFITPRTCARGKVIGRVVVVVVVVVVSRKIAISAQGLYAQHIEWAVNRRGYEG